MMRPEKIEAVVSRVVSQIRQLFAIILTGREGDQPQFCGINTKAIYQKTSRIKPDYKLEIYPLNFVPKCIMNLLSCQVHTLESTLSNCGMLEPEVRMMVHDEVYRETYYDTHTLNQFMKINLDH